jgi:hypothetical protein
MAAPVVCIVKVEGHCCRKQVEAGAEGGSQSHGRMCRCRQSRWRSKTPPVSPPVARGLCSSFRFMAGRDGRDLVADIEQAGDASTALEYKSGSCI